LILGRSDLSPTFSTTYASLSQGFDLSHAIDPA
jgi:hypothetical protein